MEKRYFRERVEILAATTGQNDLKYKVEKPLRIYYFEEVVVENKTHDFTLIRYGTISFGDFHQYEEQQNPLAATLYPWEPETPLRVFDTETLLARCTGVTAGDVLVMEVAGYYITITKPVELEKIEKEAER